MNKCFIIRGATVLLLCLFSSFAVAQNPINDSGTRVFVEALRNQGANPRIVHSGKIAFILSEERKPDSEDIIQKSISDDIQHYTDELKNTPKGSEEYNRITELLRNKDRIEKNCREMSQKRTSSSAKYRITFCGGTPFVDVKQEIFDLSKSNEKNIEENNKNEDEKNIPVMKIIGNNADVFGRSKYIWHRDGTGSSITIDANWAIPLINELGRARGHRLSAFSALFLIGGTQDQIKSFSFNSEIVEKFIAMNDELVKNSKTSGIRVTEKKEFEGNFVWVLTIPQPADKRINKKVNGKTIIGVDPARGYICPLIEEYVQETCVVRYESSGYYQDVSSGLWYPRKTVDTEFDLNTKEQLRQSTYEIIPEETEINIPISEDEFVFTVPGGWSVIDRQGIFQMEYRSLKKTKLKFQNGSIEMAKNRDFITEAEFERRYGEVTSIKISNFSFVRIVCVVLGIIFILAAYIGARQRKGNRGQ